MFACGSKRINTATSIMATLRLLKPLALVAALHPCIRSTLRHALAVFDIFETNCSLFPIFTLYCH